MQVHNKLEYTYTIRNFFFINVGGNRPPYKNNRRAACRAHSVLIDKEFVCLFSFYATTVKRKMQPVLDVCFSESGGQEVHWAARRWSTIFKWGNFISGIPGGAGDKLSTINFLDKWSVEAMARRWIVLHFCFSQQYNLWLWDSNEKIAQNHCCMLFFQEQWPFTQISFIIMLQVYSTEWT